MYKKIFLVLILVLLIATPIHATNWKPINYSNPDLIKESGLTIEEFNNLTQSEWLELLNNKEKVNFAFSATNSNGDDITSEVNPDLIININGMEDSEIVNFDKIEANSTNSAPSGEQWDNLKDEDGDGYLDVWYLEQLAYMGETSTSRTKKYELMRSLDFNNPDSYLNPNTNMEKWTSGKGWKPIGIAPVVNGNVKSNIEDTFSGAFNGNYHSIKNLYINRPNEESVGLFGDIQTDYTIENIALIDVIIEGKSSVGSLAGRIRFKGKVEDSYTTGFVKGNALQVGGFIGRLRVDSRKSGVSVGDITVKNSYTTCDVYGKDDRTGLFVGSHWEAIITDSYAAGQSLGTTKGFLGHTLTTVTGYPKTINSFWDVDTSGVDESPQGTPLTTFEMQTAQTFIDAGWNTDIWELQDGQYPKLKFNN